MSYSNPDLNNKLYYSGIYCSFILAYLKLSDPRAVLFFYFIFIFALHDCGFIIFFTKYTAFHHIIVVF